MRFLILCVLFGMCTNFVVLVNSTSACDCSCSCCLEQPKTLNKLWPITRGAEEANWIRKESTKVQLEWFGVEYLQLTARSLVTSTNQKLIADFENHFQEGKLLMVLSLLDLNGRMVCFANQYFDSNGGVQQSLVFNLQACNHRFDQVDEMRLEAQYKGNVNSNKSSLKLRLLNIRLN